MLVDESGRLKMTMLDVLTRAAERERELEAMVKELADEVEAQVLADYCDANGQLVHVSYQRKYARDIEPVLRARRLLENSRENTLEKERRLLEKEGNDAD